MYTYVCITYIHTCINIYRYTYTYIYMYIYMHIDTYAHTYMHTYIYIHMHAHKPIWSQPSIVYFSLSSICLYNKYSKEYEL